MDIYILGGLIMLAFLGGGGLIMLAIERRQLRKEQQAKVK
jgi:hypothetical protein